MSEMQLIEEQHIYEVIRSGITKGGSSFEMARHVLDALSDDGYIITRPSPIISPPDFDEVFEWADEAVIPEDAFTARYIEGCGAPPTAQDDVVVEPVTDDALHDALAAAQSEIQYCHDELKGVTSHEIGYGGMTYKQLETIIKALSISLPTDDALRDKPMTEEEICQLIFEGSGRQFFPDEVQDVFQKLKAAGVLFVKED